MEDNKSIGPLENVKSINAKLNNPLAGFTHAQLADQAEEYCRKHQIEDEEDIRAFRLGPMIAQVRSSIPATPLFAGLGPNTDLIFTGPLTLCRH